MVTVFQDIIWKVHDFFDFFHFGLFFIFSVVTVVFTGRILYLLIIRPWGDISKVQKFIFIPALLFTIAFGLNLIFAGDITSDFSPEEMARFFAEELSNRRIDELAENHHLLAPDYMEAFSKEWCTRSNEFGDMYSKAKDYRLLEYHYRYGDIDEPEKATVVLRNIKLLNVGAAKNAEDVVQCDLDFKIYLEKVAVPSRFLGKHLRWRICGFSYAKGQPYTMKEWTERLIKKGYTIWR